MSCVFVRSDIEIPAEFGWRTEIQNGTRFPTRRRVLQGHVAEAGVLTTLDFLDTMGLFSWARQGGAARTLRRRPPETPADMNPWRHGVVPAGALDPNVRLIQANGARRRAHLNRPRGGERRRSAGNHAVPAPPSASHPRSGPCRRARVRDPGGLVGPRPCHPASMGDHPFEPGRRTRKTTHRSPIPVASTSDSLRSSSS